MKKFVLFSIVSLFGISLVSACPTGTGPPTVQKTVCDSLANAGHVKDSLWKLTGLRVKGGDSAATSSGWLFLGSAFDSAASKKYARAVAEAAFDTSFLSPTQAGALFDTTTEFEGIPNEIRMAGFSPGGGGRPFGVSFPTTGRDSVVLSTDANINPYTVKMDSALVSGDRLGMAVRKPFIYDDFDGLDQLINGRVAPTGQVWSASGAGVDSAKIRNGKVSTTDNTYMYLSNGGQIVTRAACTFSYGSTQGTDRDATAQTILLDSSSIGLNTMYHLIWGPNQWILQKRIDGGSFVGIGNGGLNLNTDGTVYAISIEVDASSNTVTVVAPDGNRYPISDPDILRIKPTFIGYQIGPDFSNAYKSYFNSVDIGKTIAPSIRAEGLGAAASDLTALYGTGGTQQQNVNATLVGPGWFRIANQATFGNFGLNGTVNITAKDHIGRNAIWKVDLGSTASVDPFLAQKYFVRYIASPITKLRLSTDFSTHSGLDAYVANGDTVFANFNFVGIMNPVGVPVIGAVPYSSDSVIITAINGVPNLYVGASDTVPYTDWVRDYVAGVIPPNTCGSIDCDSTGTGKLARKISPLFTAPDIGAATGGSLTLNAVTASPNNGQIGLHSSYAYLNGFANGGSYIAGDHNNFAFVQVNGSTSGALKNTVQIATGNGTTAINVDTNQNVTLSHNLVISGTCTGCGSATDSAYARKTVHDSLTLGVGDWSAHSIALSGGVTALGTVTGLVVASNRQNTFGSHNFGNDTTDGNDSIGGNLNVGGITNLNALNVGGINATIDHNGNANITSLSFGPSGSPVDTITHGLILATKEYADSISGANTSMQGVADSLFGTGLFSHGFLPNGEMGFGCTAGGGGACQITHSVFDGTMGTDTMASLNSVRTINGQYLLKVNFKDSANTRLLFPTGPPQGLGTGNDVTFNNGTFISDVGVADLTISSLGGSTPVLASDVGDHIIPASTSGSGPVALTASPTFSGTVRNTGNFRTAGTDSIGGVLGLGVSNPASVLLGANTTFEDFRNGSNRIAFGSWATSPNAAIIFAGGGGTYSAPSAIGAAKSLGAFNIYADTSSVHYATIPLQALAWSTTAAWSATNRGENLSISGIDSNTDVSRNYGFVRDGQLIWGRSAATTPKNSSYSIHDNGAMLIDSGLTVVGGCTGCAGTSGSFTATLGGVSGTVTETVTYELIDNNTVVLKFPTDETGTSNTTGMTFSGLPAALQPTVPAQIFGYGYTTATTIVPCTALFTNSSTVTFAAMTTFGALFSSTGWAAAAVTKGIPAQVFTYNLN